MATAIEKTFQDLWNRKFEAKARAQGAIDADIPTVQAAVKSLIVDSGWGTVSGSLSFVSVKDYETCVACATATLTAAVTKASGARQTKAILAANVLGHSPTSATLSANTYQVVRTTANFNPVMAKVGDNCPRCNSPMVPVGLVNGRTAIYCTQDRVVLPVS